MSFLRFFRKSSHRRNQAARPKRACLCVEPLENRVTPSVTLSNGHLIVNGDDGGARDDAIKIDLRSSGGVAVTLNGNFFPFEFGQVATVDINPGGGINSVSLDATPVGVSVRVNDASSAINDTVILADAPRNLNMLGGSVTVQGPGGSGIDTVTVILEDTSNAAANTYTVTANSVSRSHFAGLTYSGVHHVNLVGGSASNTYNVSSADSHTLYLIDGGSQSDAYNLATGHANALAGQVTVITHGASAADRVVLHDEADLAYGSFDFEADTAPGGIPVLDIGGNGCHVLVQSPIPVTINEGTGGDTFFVAALQQRLTGWSNPLALMGGTGTDSLVVYDTLAPSTENYVVDSSSFALTGGPAITFTGVHYITVNGGNNSSSFSVAGLTNDTNVTFNAGNGVNNVLVGNTTPTGLDDLDGFVSVNGAPFGYTTVTLHDQGQLTGSDADIYDDSVLVSHGAVHYAGIQALEFDGGRGGNSVGILGTPVGLFTTINVGPDGGVVQAGVGLIDNIRGPLVVNGQGNTRFFLVDQDASTPQTYTLTGTPTGASIRRGSFFATCNNLQSMFVTGGSGGNLFSVTAAPGVPVNLFGGSGNNTLAGPSAATSWLIQGAGSGTLGANVSFNDIANLAGGSDNDTFTFTAAGSLAGSLTGGAGFDIVDDSAFAGPITVNLQTGSGPGINGAPGGLSSLESWIATASTADTLIGRNANTSWLISGQDSGTVGTMGFVGFENLVGGSGVDVFRFSASGSLSGFLSGGGAPLRQGNWLDCTGLNVPVNVNLATGVATGVAGKIFSIQNVHGSDGGSTLVGNAQGNILIGGTGADTITGGTGASLLIGDTGADAITGGSAAVGDILIGDVTSMDRLLGSTQGLLNLNALMAILAEWQSADTYDVRFHDINSGTGGGLNGPAKLYFGLTVLDDGAADTVSAAPATRAPDWFFRGAGDTLLNVQPGEHINNNTPAAFKNRTVTSPIVEGGRATVSGTITEPDPQDRFILEVNWGDGTSTRTYDFPPGSDGLRVSVSHRYRHPGVYTIALSWHDPTGPANQATLTVTVNSVAPLVAAGADAAIKTGQTFARAGSFTDPGGRPWTATVDYGDGAEAQPLGLKGKHFELHHRYREPGTYHVVVRVLDADGNVGTASFDITVK